MRKSTYIKTFWNEKYFELPDNLIKSKLTAFKFGFNKNKINLVDPFVFLCNKTTSYDKTLLSNALKGNFVFLKDEVIQKIYENTLSKEEYSELIDTFEALKNAFISVVIFPEKNLTIFGKTATLPLEITKFIYDTKFDIKFLSLVGTYFASPVWAPDFRKCETRFHHQFTIKHEDVEDIIESDFNMALNNYMPSSATVYSQRFNPYIRSNTKAHNLETLFYCCSNCKKFFTVYSEFSCIKCRECGTAVEFSSNGNLMLSKNVTDLISYADLQFEELNKLYFDDKKPMIEYPFIKLWISSNDGVNDYVGAAKLDIFCNKLTLTYPSNKLTIKLLDITLVEYVKNNTLILTLKSKDKIYLSGNKKENFFIIHDLHKIIHKKID